MLSVLTLGLAGAVAYAPSLSRVARGGSPLRAPPLSMAADPTKVYQRAEFWNKEQATVLEMVNVLGRWEKTEQWRTRSEFSVVENERKPALAHTATKKRFEMAQRMGMAERVAMQQNVKNLPFTNAALAASVGKTVEDFESMEVTRGAVNVVFDGLMESAAGLIPPDVCDRRRDALVEGGELNEAAFQSGLFKARALVIVSWFLLGKGQILGFFIGVKVLFDTLDVWSRINVPGIDYLYWVLALYATFSAAGDDSYDVPYETYREDGAAGTGSLLKAEVAGSVPVTAPPERESVETK